MSKRGSDKYFRERRLFLTGAVVTSGWKYVAGVELDLSPEISGVSCRPSEINQVLLNLIVNSAHAIEEAAASNPSSKGKISIATRREHDEVVVCVADTGCGIPEAICDRIYDPFFTTKAIGRGTGQGLAITHRLVCEHHGGSIACESKVGEGTRFTIRLPNPTASRLG
jgi:signal transduction histidine kinase